MICSYMWYFVVYNSPATHPRISIEERDYIEQSLNTQPDEKVCINDVSLRTNLLFLALSSSSAVDSFNSCKYQHVSSQKVNIIFFQNCRVETALIQKDINFVAEYNTLSC